MRVGVDTGGTFTDVVGDDGAIAKVPSTPSDPSQAVVAGVGELGRGPAGVLAHGTTVATNALLERRGGTVALVTNEGLGDVIEIARQKRPSLYDHFADRPEPLVPRRLRLEVSGRLAADGTELEPVGEPPAVPEGVDAVAVCLLHADLNAAHEQAVAAALRSQGLDVTCSHEVAPEFREYERTSTSAINAYVRPPTGRYLARLEGTAGEVLVMTSAGGLVPLHEAASRPAALLLSGPAGGVWAAAAAAEAAGFPDAVTFDMGGTSTDVCLVLGGQPAPAGQREVGGLPVRLPSLDIHTIGAGGGSIAHLDPGGALRVGPRSAGAEPGPACYGKGGTEPTVTDADLVLGRIPAGAAFPGLGVLDGDAAAAALTAAGVRADGVVAVVDAAMVQAVRAVSVERGVDPTGLALVAFGGAGPLHACAIADALGMPAVVVPPRAGVLSAVGLLCGPRQADLVRSWPTPADHAGVPAALEELAAHARSTVLCTLSKAESEPTFTEPEGPGAGVEVDIATAVDCRYAGQSHELTVATVGDFAAEHERRNGYARPGAPVEVVALRATARVASPVRFADLPVPQGRRPATGPAVLAEPDCTVWLPEGWTAEVAASGAWVLRRSAGGSST